MKKSLPFIFILLTACSSIDSTRPFDAEQASVLLQQHGPTKPAKQMVSLALNQKHYWHKTDFPENELGSFVVLTPQSESVTKWNESIQSRMLPYDNMPNITATKLVQAEIMDVKNNCKTSDSTILDQTPHYIVYRLETNDCLNRKNRWQIGKIFNGTDGVYSVRYLADYREISKNHFDQISQIIKTAQLVKDPRSI